MTFTMRELRKVLSAMSIVQVILVYAFLLVLSLPAFMVFGLSVADHYQEKFRKLLSFEHKLRLAYQNGVVPEEDLAEAARCLEAAKREFRSNSPDYGAVERAIERGESFL